MAQPSKRSRSRHQGISQSAPSSPSNSQQTAQPIGAPPPPPPTSSQQIAQQGGTQRNKRWKTVRAWLNTVGVLLIPIILNASKMIMRPEQVAEERLDLCLGQTDCRYDEGPLRESEPVPENAAPHP